MITSLIKDDLITFYEIHESFDKLNMFNSNWEKEVSQKLTKIDYSLKDLIYSIHDEEANYNVIKWLHTEQIHKIYNYKLKVKRFIKQWTDGTTLGTNCVTIFCKVCNKDFLRG